MTRISTVLLLSIGLAACGGNASKPLVQGASTEKKPSKPKGPYIPEVRAGYEGYYTGLFEAADGSGGHDNNRISVRIDSARDGKVWGTSIVAGNERPFTGKAEDVGGRISITAQEPGTDKWDGTFLMALDGDTLSGRWDAFDKGLPVPARTYRLAKRAFRYDPSATFNDEVFEGFMIATYAESTDKGERLSEKVLELNPSKVLLKSRDVENLYKSDLELLRNSIYARHGYSFRNVRMRRFFDHYVDWYMPVSTDVTAQLTPIEQKNIALLKRYEGHATKYYDSFGR
ncbi:YARHG domain-containing protein [Flaviaesturariibacter amylovorans]|uniref:YARHG domain-containing protein n=1 Tax=Flaviaesturariibacter amylovorans TaxID=1084520 RepID=A0ABP8HPA9_9BACT